VQPFASSSVQYLVSCCTVVLSLQIGMDPFRQLNISLLTLASGDYHLSAVSIKSNIMGPAGFQEQVTSSPSNPLLTMTSIKLKAHKQTHKQNTHTHTQLHWNSAQAIKFVTCTRE